MSYIRVKVNDKASGIEGGMKDRALRSGVPPVPKQSIHAATDYSAGENFRRSGISYLTHILVLIGMMMICVTVFFESDDTDHR